jgi:2-iminobutanoate/2-iminopropanoate deaminase
VTRKATLTSSAPTPGAFFSQAIRKGGILTLAGQAGLDPDTRAIVSTELGEQTQRALQNMAAVLEASGSSWQDVVSMRVFLAHDAEMATMNAAYVTFFEGIFDKENGPPPPTRTTIYCGLPHGLHIEIDGWAVIGD